MAYNQSFNPDRLPAFAEPENASQRNTMVQNERSRPPPLPPQDRRLSSAMPAQSGHRYTNSYTGQESTSSRKYSLNQSPSDGYRPASISRPPPSPAIAPSVDQKVLWPLFQAVDRDGSGQLSKDELGEALVNGDWSAFDPYTVELMIRLFDANRSGTIGFNEFCGLWTFLASWRALFDRFDVDKSGNINRKEFMDALVAFGYRLSSGFVQTLFDVHDKKREGAISFDIFVQSCISLKRMTDIFKKYDTDRDGFITMSFEDFLTEIIRQR
ncbi:BgTH12-05743 [Blumeria graminis f. sp. triticale]|uniref:Bgt-1439 n=3 Tax=Blumeria graminis TaxID=34373 RepID=A0A061HCR7_BLUGR|nr:Penta-EF-hand protein [Blumeria graminis f. sp. tritici 96224]CAD6504004.1 BgTH12-05743 [Blumeria graminis f. sp. triticale]VDB90735.1 Bgt-1439 [Blumeria graminis f. sp. tritici]